MNYPFHSIISFDYNNSSHIFHFAWPFTDENKNGMTSRTIVPSCTSFMGTITKPFQIIGKEKSEFKEISMDNVRPPEGVDKLYSIRIDGLDNDAR